MITCRAAVRQSWTVGLAATALAAVAAWPAAAARMDRSLMADPVGYCRAVGTIDAPDQRYLGPAVPDWMAGALRRATGAPATAPREPFRQAVWRCDEGEVLACAVGANLPCGEKAVVSRTPPEGAVAFCRGQPGAAVVPAFAVDHANVFEWRCDGDAPVIVRQVAEVDRRGFVAGIWYRVGKE